MLLEKEAETAKPGDIGESGTWLFTWAFNG